MKSAHRRQLFGGAVILALTLVVLGAAAGAASPTTTANPAAAFSAYGELLAIGSQSISLQTADGQVLDIAVDPRASIIVGRNRNAGLGDLHAGQWIRARVLQDQAGQFSTAFVRVVPERPAAPAGSSNAISKSEATARVRESKTGLQATAPPRTCGQAGGSQAVGDWPMLGQDGAHGFYNAGELRLRPPLTLAWMLEGDWNVSAPAVVGDVAYVGAYDGFHALDLQGQTELWWQSGLNADNEFSSPAVANGVIYFGTWTGDVYALDAATGGIVWQQNIIPAGDVVQIYSPAVAGGVVYLTADRWPAAGGSVVTVYALDATTGNSLWSTDVVTTLDWDNVTSDPVVANGMVYVGTYKYGVFALNAGDGSVAWNFPMPAGAWASDINFDGYVVVQNGLVYVPFTFGTYPNVYDILYALDASSGSPVWTYDPVWPEQFSSSVLVHGGSAYVMMEKPGDPQFAYLVELNALTGQEVGRLEQVDDGTDGGWFWLSAANGVLYTTSAGMTVRAYDLSYGGADVWSYQTLWSIEVPAAPASGRLVVVDEWPALYVFEGAAGAGGICGGVYEDINGNGAWNLGEPGIAGVTVELKGPVSLTTSTGADGTYSFTALTADTYSVVETDPPGYSSVAANPGSTGGTAIDPNTIANIPLPAGYSSTDNNFGDQLGGCTLEVTKTCLVEPPAAGSLLCQSGIAATTLRYTGDYIADATVVFQGKDNGHATYSNVELIPGETVLTDPGQNGWTIDGTPKLGSRTTIVITNNATGDTYEEIIHTSCSAIYEAGSPAPLDGKTPNPPNSAKGDPSPTWLVESFIDKNGNVVTVPSPPVPASTCEIVPQPAPSCGTGGHEDGEHGDGHGDQGTKPYSLTLRYTGADCSASSHSQDPQKASCTDLGTLTDPAFILVTDKKNPNDRRAKVFFSGDVSVGQAFDVEAANAGESKLKSQTYYYIYDQEGGTLLQNGTFHTSCSQPLVVGDVFGSLALEGINGEGASGNEVTYTYTVTNAGIDAITDIFLTDDKLGAVAGPFELAGGQSQVFQMLAEILETTTNTAIVTGQAGDRQCTATASATVVVAEPPPPECIVEGDDELDIHHDKVEWELENEGGDPITIDRITIEWPADLGDLRKVKLGGKTIYDERIPPSSTTIDSDWKGNTQDRQIAAGHDAELKFEFEHRADPSQGDFAITVHFTEGCSVEFTPGPGGGTFQCTKPINELTMIWDGTVDPIGVKAWKDNPGEELLATFDSVQVGQAVVVAGYAPKRGNDVIWEIFETDSSGTKIGESTFHLSCSDRDMDGPEDCGKRQGDGKGRSGYINDWILEGMVDAQTSFTCSAP